MVNYEVEKLKVKVSDFREQMGIEAAKDIIKCINELFKTQEEVRIIFAAAPSQDDMTNELVKYDNIEWSRVVAFHMDEYIGLPLEAEQRFGNYLKKRVFDILPFKEVYYLADGSGSTNSICKEYENKLKSKSIDIICMGIGENGHIAFNDPPVADFNDSKLVKIVELDEICRQQQVNDGCFNSIEQVPKQALTLTIPVFMSAKNLFCVVPNKRKAKAVKDTLEGPISTQCPASILRNHDSALLYLDADSSRLL